MLVPCDAQRARNRRTPLRRAAVGVTLLAAVLVVALALAVQGGVSAAGAKTFAVWNTQTSCQRWPRRLGRQQYARPRIALAASGEEEEDEVSVWKEAYALEMERSELLDEQLRAELDRIGEMSVKLKEEFEGCIVDLEPAPERPAEGTGVVWAEAYTALRRCNEQAELQLTEMRARAQEYGVSRQDALKEVVSMDFGPIRYKGLKFKDISISRFGMAAGSSFYFVELPMPLGLKLEEKMVEPSPGARVVRAVDVAEVVEGGSASGDGRIRAGDLLRAITVPQRRVAPSEDDDEVGGNFEGASVALGIGAGTLTKALLVIPSESSFPFERVLDDMAKNREIDSLVGLVLERRFEPEPEPEG